LQAGLRNEARPLIERYGEGLIRAGHVAPLERWNLALSGAAAPPTPRGLLLHARVLAERNALDALGAFQEACAAAGRAGDQYGEIQAACGLLQAVFVLWGDFRPVNAMLPIAERVLEDRLEHPDATSELECLTGLLAGWMLANPNHPRRVPLFERMVDLAGDPAVDAGVRLGAGARCSPTASSGRNPTSGSADRAARRGGRHAWRPDGAPSYLGARSRALLHSTAESRSRRVPGAHRPP
jgi:hypothetical protein